MLMSFAATIIFTWQCFPVLGLAARIYEAHPRSFGGQLLGVSRDGNRLYTVSAPSGDEPAYVLGWDSVSGKLLSRHPLTAPDEEIAWHAGGYRHVGLGEEGLRVAVRSIPKKDWSHTLRIVDPDSGRLIRSGINCKYPQREEDFRGLNRPFIGSSPDGKWLIRVDTACHLYDALTGAETVIQPGGPVTATGFGHDGQLLSVRCDDNVIRIYELPGGKLVCTLPKLGDEQYAAVFTNDGKRIANWVRHGGEWSLDLIDIANGERRSVLRQKPVAGKLVFARDNAVFAWLPLSDEWPWGTPSGDWEVRETASSRLLARAPTSMYGSQAIFSADGKTLYVQSGGHWERRPTIAWDVTADRPIASAPYLLSAIERFRFTRNGKLVGVAGGFVHTWEASTGKQLDRKRVPCSIDWNGGAAFSPIGDRLICATAGGRLVFWDLQSGVEQSAHIDLRKTKDDAAATWFGADGMQFAEYADGLLVLRDSRDGREIRRYSLPDAHRPRFGPFGHHPAVLHSSGWVAYSNKDDFGAMGLRAPPPVPVVVLSPPSRNEPPVIFELKQSVDALAISPDGRYLAIVGHRHSEFRRDEVDPGGPEIFVWDTRTKQLRGPFVIKGKHEVIAARHSPDGHFLAVCFHPVGVTVVETATWQVQATLPALTPNRWGWHGVPERDCDALAWSPNGRLMATATPEGGLLIWDLMNVRNPASTSAGSGLEKLWNDLGSPDGSVGFAAIQALASIPTESVPFLIERMPPVKAVDHRRVETLIRSLGAAEFAERERAGKELNEIGRLAETDLRQAFQTTESPEARRRLKIMIDRLDAAKFTADELRAQRAVEAVTWIRSDDAIKLLTKWANGAAGAILTVAAKTALALKNANH